MSSSKSINQRVNYENTEETNGENFIKMIDIFLKNLSKTRKCQ